MRAFPRTAENDPYREGLLALAAALRPLLDGAALHVAFNEFCAPTIEDAIATAVAGGARVITVVPSMLTPGGVHSEVEIPEAIAHARARFPEAQIRYAWPFDLQAIARMLAAQARG
ncbi:MAG: CbiX/SirB N-terminal domain-containing protein [Minicystis sp.]